MSRLAAAALAAATAAMPAAGAELTVDVAGLRSDEGLVRVAVCPRESFTSPSCPHVGVAPASRGRAVVEGLPPGVYAVQAFHDEDGDGTLDRRGFLPSEGLGFSRDAPMRMGPPRFNDAAVRIEKDGRITVTMRYYGQ